MILLNQNLEAFLSIVETGSVSSTAKKINLSQSAVTQRIKALENSLKVNLFTRSKSGMKVTSEGEHLFQFCKTWSEKEGELLSRLQGTGRTNEINVKIVCPASLISGRLIMQCKNIYASWPELNLSFSSDSHLNRLEILKKGAADFAILRTHEVTNQFDSKKIQPLEYTLIGPASWKNRSMNEILGNERYLAYYEKDEISLEYLNKYNFLDQVKRQILYLNDSQSLLKMVELGLGFGLVSSELLKEAQLGKSICILNNGKSLKINLALAWFRRDAMPHYLKELVGSIH
jgi:DNA-binding transcriptional LysR family regulator